MPNLPKSPDLRIVGAPARAAARVHFLAYQDTVLGCPGAVVQTVVGPRACTHTHLGAGNGNGTCAWISESQNVGRRTPCGHIPGQLQRGYHFCQPRGVASPWHHCQTVFWRRASAPRCSPCPGLCELVSERVIVGVCERASALVCAWVRGCMGAWVRGARQIFALR